MHFLLRCPKLEETRSALLNSIYLKYKNIPLLNTNQKFVCLMSTEDPYILHNAVKPAVAVTCIKRDPPLSGHFRVPPNDFECKCTSIKCAPVQRGQRSAKFAPKS